MKNRAKKFVPFFKGRSSTKNWEKNVFYEQKLTYISKNNYLLSGWFACVKDCTIKEIFKALNWQWQKNKKVKWIAFIKKTNQLSIKLSKYIGWRNMDKKNKIINILARNFKINRNKFIFQER